MNKELRKKISEYCASQATCEGCIFKDPVNSLECLVYIGTADKSTRLKALKRFKKEVLEKEEENDKRKTNIK